MPLGPLPDTANVVRVKMNGTNQTTPWVALFYWHYLGSSPTGAQLTTFCGAFQNAWSSTMLGAFSSAVSAQNTEAWDLARRDGANASGGSPATGTRVGGPLPTSIAAVASWKVNYRWRGGHPRTYWPAGAVGDLVNGHLWSESARLAFENANKAFLTAVNGLTLGGAGGYLTAINYVHTVTAADGTKDVQYIIPPRDLQIQTALVDARVDTQRRRLGPDLQMASAYTVLLGRARGFANSDIVIATIGSAQAVIVRDLVAMNVGATTESIHLYARAGSENFHLAVLPFEPGTSVHLELRQRLAPGDELHAYSASTDWNASVTGYLLGLEPVQSRSTD